MKTKQIIEIQIAIQKKKKIALNLVYILDSTFIIQAKNIRFLKKDKRYILRKLSQNRHVGTLKVNIFNIVLIPEENAPVKYLYMKNV